MCICIQVYAYIHNVYLQAVSRHGQNAHPHTCTHTQCVCLIIQIWASGVIKVTHGVPNKERRINRRRRHGSHTNDTAECNICQASLCPWGREAYGNRIVARMKRLRWRRVSRKEGPASSPPDEAPRDDGVGAGRKRKKGVKGRRRKRTLHVSGFVRVCVHICVHTCV